MARVKIIGENPGGVIHTFVDGKEINEISTINFDVYAKDRIPRFGIEMYGVPDIDLEGRVDFSFSPQTVEEAAKVMRHSFMTDKDLYNALLEGIESSLRESTVEWGNWRYTETARKIADRLIGKE